MKKFNFPSILEYNHGLKHLLIDVSITRKLNIRLNDKSIEFDVITAQVQNDTDLRKEMKGKLPYKLYNITLTGRALKNIHPEILRVSFLTLVANSILFAKIIVLGKYFTVTREIT